MRDFIDVVGAPAAVIMVLAFAVLFGGIGMTICQNMEHGQCSSTTTAISP